MAKSFNHLQHIIFGTSQAQEYVQTTELAQNSLCRWRPKGVSNISPAIVRHLQPLHMLFGVCSFDVKRKKTENFNRNEKCARRDALTQMEYYSVASLQRSRQIPNENLRNFVWKWGQLEFAPETYSKISQGNSDPRHNKIGWGCTVIDNEQRNVEIQWLGLQRATSSLTTLKANRKVQKNGKAKLQTSRIGWN